MSVTSTSQSWLQIDFRQERRWKIATAYQLAHKIAEWHQADDTGRKALQVTPPRRSPPYSVPTDESFAKPSDLANSAEVSSTHQTADVPVASPAAPHADCSPDPSSKNSPETFRKGLLLNEALPPHTNEPRKSHLQNKPARIAIFDISPQQTTIELDDTVLKGSLSEFVGRNIERCALHKIFNDLPLFGDMESLSGKRADEASPYHGRITRIAKHLESKPLLVSTLKPARNCVGQKWRNLSPLVVEDLREQAENRSETPPTQAHLFSGRKTREPKDLSLSSGPRSIPAEIKVRTEPLVWSSTDEELLKTLCTNYNSNWKLVADVFNATSGSSVGHLTPRDCYDCWNRLNSPAKSAVEVDSTTTEPLVAPPSQEAPSNQMQVDEAIPTESTPDTEPKRSATFPSPPAKRVSRQEAVFQVAQKVKEKRAANVRKPCKCRENVCKLPS